MTNYTTSPEKAVATCTAPGCKWQRIYWKHDSKLPPETRAILGLARHRRVAHAVKVLINGR